MGGGSRRRCREEAVRCHEWMAADHREVQPQAPPEPSGCSVEGYVTLLLNRSKVVSRNRSRQLLHLGLHPLVVVAVAEALQEPGDQHLSSWGVARRHVFFWSCHSTRASEDTTLTG